MNEQNHNSEHLKTVEEISTLLCVSKKTIYRLFAQNEIIGLRVGRAIRFNYADVIESLKSKQNSQNLYSTGSERIKRAVRSLKMK